MFHFTDQLGRPIEMAGHAKRIVSLVPSQTELLAHLGLEEEVVGITKFCVHPGKWFHSKFRVGGTKMINVDAVASLMPDLIIANKEENVKEQLQLLEKIAPVWISDVCNLKDAISMILSIGELTGRQQNATALIDQIRNDFTKLRGSNQMYKPVRTAYLIWQEPYMTTGGDTFIHDMLSNCSLCNVFAETTRYPVITVPDIIAKDTGLVLLSSEPYPFKQKHADELSTRLPGVRIMLVDGEMFSWYGSRMLLASSYFHQLLNKIHSPS